MQMAKTRVQLNISSEGKNKFDEARTIMVSDPQLGLPSADKAIKVLSQFYMKAKLGKQ